MQYKFPKSERLKLQRDFAEIREKGIKINSKKIYSYLVIEPATGPIINLKVAFIIPKRNIKKASARNLIRRRMREAFRLNVSGLRQILQENNLMLKLVIIYPQKIALDYQQIEQDIKVLVEKITSHIREQTGNKNQFPEKF